MYHRTLSSRLHIAHKYNNMMTTVCTNDITYLHGLYQNRVKNVPHKANILRTHAVLNN